MTAKAVLWPDSEESFQSVFIRLMYISLTPLTFSCLMTLAFTQAPHQHFTRRRQYKQQPWLTARLSRLHNSSYLGTVISVIITQPLFIIRDEALDTAEGQTITEQWQGLPLLWWKHTRWELPAATGKKERMDKLRLWKLFSAMVVHLEASHASIYLHEFDMDSLKPQQKMILTILNAVLLHVFVISDTINF